MRTQELNRLESPESQEVRKSILALIGNLDEQIDDMNEQIKKTVDKDDDLRGKRDLIESITGIGPITSATVLGETPHIEEFRSAKALTAFAGLCPQLRQSGRSLSSSKTTQYGNRAMRHMLYMSSLAAQRANAPIRTFAARLRARGKTPMEINIAVARKLLVLIYGVLKTGQPFDPKWAKA